MGCGGSKKATEASGASGAAQAKPAEQQQQQASSTGAVKVYGVPASSNSLAPILIAMEAKVGGMELVDVMGGQQKSPEYLKMNPYHHVPVVQDGAVVIGESIACARYMAIRHKPELYPLDKPELCGWIDFACYSWMLDVYAKYLPIGYFSLGFTGAPADHAAAQAEFTKVQNIWTEHFLKGKFVAGDNLSIADYKVVPFLFTICTPGCEKQTGYKAPDRMVQYVDDFMKAVNSTGIFKEAGGYALAEMTANRAGSGTGKDLPSYSKVAYQDSKAKWSPSSKGGKVKVYGMPGSQNCLGAIILAKDAGCGDMEMTNVMEGEHHGENYKAMNPFSHVPTLSDGDYAIAESNAILRYIALKYKPEYYPKQDKALCAWIDFAVEAFHNEVYSHGHTKVVYVALGFAKPPEDQQAANKTYFDAIETWLNHHRKGKFVGGDKVTIADLKAVPYLFGACHEGVKRKLGFEASSQCKQYVEDICKAVPATGILKEAGGWAVGEMLSK